MTLIRKLLTLLRRGRGRNVLESPSGSSPTAGDPLTEPHYPTRYHSTDHTLPTGVPDRANVHLWIDREVARLSDAGVLDEGTATVIDPEIERQRLQWREAITQYARVDRTRTSLAIRDDQIRALVAKLEELATLRVEVDRLVHLEAHYRDILAGAPVTVPTTPPQSTAVRQSASSGLLPAAVPSISDIGSLLNQPTDGAPSTVTGSRGRPNSQSARPDSSIHPQGATHATGTTAAQDHDRDHTADDDSKLNLV